MTQQIRIVGQSGTFRKSLETAFGAQGVSPSENLRFSTTKRTIFIAPFKTSKDKSVFSLSRSFIHDKSAFPILISNTAVFDGPGLRRERDTPDAKSRFGKSIIDLEKQFLAHRKDGLVVRIPDPWVLDDPEGERIKNWLTSGRKEGSIQFLIPQNLPSLLAPAWGNLMGLMHLATGPFEKDPSVETTSHLNVLRTAFSDLWERPDGIISMRRDAQRHVNFELNNSPQLQAA